jgi:RND family efflux transporter MFP subunit
VAVLVAVALSTASADASANDSGWRGVVKALDQPTLTTELTAVVERIGAREGMRFKKGDLLIEFDCRRYQLELAALVASMREAQAVLNTNRYLFDRGASNRNDVEIAQARFDRATAEQAALRQRLTGCRIEAPFDGVVVELSIATHEISTANKPLMTIASTEHLEIEVIVPARQLPMLPAGSSLVFRIEDTQQAFGARVVRTGGAVDMVSQTAKIYAVFDQPSIHVLPGMGGSATRSEGAH